MKIIGILILAIALTACKSPAGDSVDGPAASKTTEPGTETPEAPAPMACKVDSDCPSRACGPCTPGEVVMYEQHAVSCTVNPCTNSRSVCGPKHLCVVHPDTKMVEDVQSEQCQKLLGSKWHLCKDKEGSALTECLDVIDAATARDEDEGCRAARDLLDG